MRWLPLFALAAAACQNTTCLDCGNGRTALLEVRGAVIDSAPAGSASSRLDTLRILNAGSGALHWTVRSMLDSPWLSMQPDSGEAGALLTVSLDPTGLAPATYRDTLVVIATSGIAKAPVTFLVTPPPPSLTFTTQPTTTVVGDTIRPAVHVALVDGANPVATFTGDVTLALDSSGHTGTLHGTTTVQAVAGVAFSDLTIPWAGYYTLKAAAPGMPADTSNTFLVIIQ